MRQKVLVLIAVYAFPSVASAATAGIAVDPLSYQIRGGLSEDWILGGSVSGPPPALPQTYNFFYNDPYGVYSGGGGGTIVTYPTPTILVTASLSCSACTPDVFVSAGGSAELTYDFKLIANPGFGADLAEVPVLFNGTVNTSLTVPGGYGGGTDVSMTVFNVSSGDYVYDQWNLPAGGYGSTIQIVPNVEYQVYMYASVSVEGSGSGAASIDPYFWIDPSFEYASDFQLVFSPGIGNDSAVPEASSWAMILSGFAGLSAARFARRRERTAA